MKIHHLNCAQFHPLGGRLWDDSERGVLTRAHMVCHVLLVEHQRGLLLVDTGLGTRGVSDPDGWLGSTWLRLWRPDLAIEHTAVAQIEALGYRREDVTDVVLTHLDLDHAGGLADFPRARVHVHRTEWEAMRNPRGMGEPRRYRPNHFEHQPNWRTYSPNEGESWLGFDAVRQLEGVPPEVLLIPLPGHSRGHSGVAIDTGNGWLLHAGDAYYVAGQINPHQPRRPLGVAAFEAFGCEIASERRANQERLRDLVVGHGAQVRVFCAHSASELDALQRVAT